MEIKEGYVPFMEYKTYYRIVNPNGKKTPLVILHGGPGSTHNSFELLDHFAFDDDRPIVMYDQIGCGLSSVELGHTELWNKETWVKELENLRQQLNLKEIHLLGHSWGGMLNIIYNCDYAPKGVKSIILSSSLSSASLWEKETHRLIRLMDDNDQKIIAKAEEENDFESEIAKPICDKYYHRYVFGPWIEGKDPECLTRKKITNGEAYVTGWGKSEFKPSGTLKDYEYTDKLKNITCPVLICSGADDESTPLQNKIMLESLGSKNKRWVLYANSRHMSYYEEHKRYCFELAKFLNEND